MLLSLLLGCPPQSAKPPSADSGDTASDDTADTADTATPPLDTGVAFVQRVADWKVSPDPLTLHEFHLGWAAWAPNAGDWVCEARFPFASRGPAATTCPECTWSFAVEASPVLPSGPACDTLFDPRRGGDSVFDEIAVEGTAFDPLLEGIEGFGFAPSYTLITSSGAEYALTDTVFWYYSSADYEGWYLMFFEYAPFTAIYGEHMLGDAWLGEVGPSAMFWDYGQAYEFYTAR